MVILCPVCKYATLSFSVFEFGHHVAVGNAIISWAHLGAMEAGAAVIRVRSVQT
ncbi:hypothetical protein SNOG_20094 [Parastagonospora nodorum SN15]|uniref:Uncharacterized protein n=1 Tax=Phaeosphaeria nodorum (strain SN15 / ATCC MYA-4574 / FGSC 10173) TaxID=321614 RepID=A9JX91_PHANO|nr:hypothetical protein SNOG_20094 [Parastagonospora nodorum SN15]EDP89783.1 hypothetical protein SNOG_20094 [Parastagonospora nodorum SN15]